MQAISNRLGEGTEPFRQRIIGMAKEVAILIQPESHYDWPTTDLSELVAICDRKEEETETLSGAQADMEAMAKENTELLAKAKTRAKTLLEEYVKNVGEGIGENYTVEWKDVE